MKRLKTLLRRILDLRVFNEQATLFLNFIQTVPRELLVKNASSKRRIGIVVSAWHYTPVAWFALTIALIYKSRNLQPVIIWDDLPFGYEGHVRDQSRVIRKVLETLKDSFEIIRLSEASDADLNSADRAEIARVATLNAISRFQSSIPTPQSDQYTKALETDFYANLKKVKAVFSTDKFEHLVLPGGVYGNSSLILWAVSRFDTRVATYDSGPGILLLSVDGVAAHQMDVAKISDEEIYRTEIAPLREQVIRLAKQEFELRRVGKDRWSYQVVPYQDNLKPSETKYDILLPLNVDWDTSALGKHRFFKEPFQWVIETVTFVLNHTSASIIIRQHPDERRASARSRHDFKGALDKLFPNSSRVRFVAAEEEVNTYNLLENAKIVLPLTSTVGIEAAILGKHVIVESDVYYSEFNFIDKAKSKEDYFEKIKHGLITPRVLNKEQIDFAYLAYFYAKIGNEIYTSFTPQNDDFKKWAAKGFESLLADPDVQLITDTLINAKPVFFWKSKQALENQNK